MFEARTSLPNNIFNVTSGHYSARIVGGNFYPDLPYDVSDTKLFDVHGKEILNWNLSSKQLRHTLHLGHIPVGHYLLNVKGLGAKSVVFLETK